MILSERPPRRARRSRWARGGWLCILTLIFASGCGYNVVRYREAGRAAPRLTIVTLDNDSEESGLELLVSDALRREVLNRGALRLVGDPAAADYTLRGRVLPVETQGRSFTGIVLALEYRITVQLELSIHGREGMVLEFAREELEASELYLASADLEAVRKNRLEALRRLSGLLASRIHDGIDRGILGTLP